MTSGRTNENELTVLIIGAGPTGLTLACELARRGVSCRLIETVPGPQPGSRGKGIQPRTLEVFDDFGMVDRVLANGRMAMPMRTTAPDGSVSMVGAEAPKPSSAVPYPSTLLIPEWRVEEALRERLAELGGAVDFGVSLVSFEQVDGAVSAVLTKDGLEETVVSRWMVGCDGGHSLVRKHAGIPFVGDTRDDVRMIVADVEADGLDRDAWHVWRSEEGVVSLCPLPSTNAFQYQSGVWPGQNPDISLGNMQATLKRISGRKDIRLTELQWSSLWRANVRIAEQYRSGNIFLAGDAAHIHSPAGGQGMNTGIQDAQNLGWKIAAVAKGASAALLDSYEAERQPVALGVLALSDALLKEAIEKKGFPARRSASTQQLGIHYRGSFLAHDDREDGATLRAGDRAPDATGLSTVEGECRLFDLTRGGHFTLLNFGATPFAGSLPADLKTLSIVQAPVVSNDVSDAEGRLANAYGAVAHTLVLIRPDGYIALISNAGDISTISEYLTAIGQRY